MSSVATVKLRHCEPTGRANARPMTGSAKQSIFLPRQERSWIAPSQVLLGRNWRLVRRPPQSKLSSPGLTGRSSTPRLLIYLKRLWNTGSPRQAGGGERGLFFFFGGGPAAGHK